ncbi:MAG: DUF2304 domain-containing protein [Bacteroidia bacterium]
MEIIPYKIQIVSIAGALLFMFAIIRLIVRGRLREEYAIIWMVCTFFLLLFSLWRNGLEFIAGMLGVFYAPSIVFLAAIFAIILFLVHLSVVNSKQQKQIKEMAQEIALIKSRKNAGCTQ